MQAMIPFPEISPEIFTVSLGSFEFALRWYAMAYIVGILMGQPSLLHLRQNTIY